VSELDRPTDEGQAGAGEPSESLEAADSNGDAVEPSLDGDALEPATAEAVAEVAEEFVSGIIEAMGLAADVSSSIDGDRAVLEIAGERLGVLIGRRGQTLDALQDLARTAVQRRLRARVRLLVDVEGYRARRRQSLAEYAGAMARRAKERGTEIELEPMNSFERKIVHDAVGEVDGASSFSEGDEPERRVIVRGD
jgi:spoIIIJ-associated protein